jgi:AcrR family transcriptional regulator
MTRNHDKREEIVQAALRVFAAKGFRKTSVEDIIGEAKVARATFYHYFKSKKDIFLELTGMILDNIYSIVEKDFQVFPSSEKEIVERMEHSLRTSFEYFRDNRAFAAVYFSEAMGMNPQLDSKVIEFQTRSSALVARVVMEGQAKGFFRDVDPYIVGTTLAFAPQHIAILWMLTGEKADVTQLVNSLVDFLFYGLLKR